MWRSHSTDPMRSSGDSKLRPRRSVLQTRASNRPCWSATSLTTRTQSAGAEIRPWWTLTASPGALRAPSSSSAGRAPTATRSPAASSDRTISRPTPYVPLVTSATVPLI